MSARRRQLAIAGFGAAALAAGVGFAFIEAEPSTRAVQPSPRSTARRSTTRTGRRSRSRNGRGSGWSVNFWATWCAPCVEEMPTLQQIAHDYGRRGVAVVGRRLSSGCGPVAPGQN